VMRQFDQAGKAKRSSGGSPPGGKTLAKLLGIEASQDGVSVPVQINYDKAIWSGLSWAVAECKGSDLRPGKPVRLRCFTAEPAAVTLTVDLYHTA
jgi:hypothetical protein